MACTDCSLCNISMDFPHWDDQSDTEGVDMRKKKALFCSPVSASHTALSDVKGDTSQLEFDLTDSLEELSDKHNGDVVYDDDQSGAALCTAETSVQSTSSNSVYSTESGFCSENTVNLHCSESSVWWSDEGAAHTENECSFTPIPVLPGRSERTPHPAGFDDYKSDIYRHRKELESRRHVKDCLRHQKEITAGIRAVLVKWLSKINQEFQLSQETLFLTVNIVDRCLQVMHVSRECFQLVGATALLIAGKHEEVTPPEIQDLLWLCGDAYTREQMIELEKIILEALHFQMFVPTGSFFLEYFASCERSSRRGQDDDGFRNARRYARYFLELSLQDYELCQYPPSMVALCAWKIAVRDCLSEYGSYPRWETEFSQTPYEKCYADFTAIISRLTRSFPEAKVLSEKYAYEDADDSERD